MFFPKLRRNAKWVFLFLALAFGLGFVGFGVGAGGVGVGDIFRGSTGSGLPSVSEAQDRVNENPKNPEAWRQLVDAQRAAGNTDSAIDALNGYVGLKPKDDKALAELAALYLDQLRRAQEEYNLAQLRVAYLAPSGAYFQSISLGGRPLELDSISRAVSAATSTETDAALSKAQNAATSAVGTYKRVAALNPDDPSVQQQLGEAAETIGDNATAIAAYKRYIQLVPKDDLIARELQRRINQLRGGTPG